MRIKSWRKFFESVEDFNDLIKFNTTDVENENILLEDFFNKNNKLSSIGTIEQYKEYLKGIFPNSKVGGIWQHISPQLFDFNRYGGGNFGKGYYFSKIGDDYGSYNSENIKFRNLVKLNVISPILGKPGEATQYIYKRLSDKFGSDKEFYPGEPEWVDVENELVEINKKRCDAIVGGVNGNLDSEICLFDKEKIYLLGSPDDINGFEKFIKR